MDTYNEAFYAEMEIPSVNSAKEIVPILINRYNPVSVVDVGCGTGAFTREFLENGVEDVIGYEGEWVQAARTLIPKANYIYTDLSKEVQTTRTYDLCLCLEVAEHLAIFSARTLVSTLTSLSSRVVFSAAIPHQGGKHHVNEQWPDFWATLFAEKEYFLEWDPRYSIWNNKKIAPCYRQNLLVFEKTKNKELVFPLSLVHPDAWTLAMKYRKSPLWIKAIRMIPGPCMKIGKKILNIIKGALK